MGLATRLSAGVLIALSGLGWSGCATQTAARFSPAAVAVMSPTAEVVQPFDALRLGKQFVAEHAGTDFLVGSGDSMLPLYRDHTVVVTQRIAVSELKAGMTVAYVGDSGRPVAHVLVRKSSQGWVAMGVGNAECDSTTVTEANLLGVVVKAFEPTRSPMVALLDEAASRSSVASMP
ncbi:MAG TPA: hypothetical protein VN775_13685 [Opitutaceae bacterium]|nr:hypothetical protein [Opitutaceae bacterium]